MLFWDLEDMAEDVSYGESHPKFNLRENGATEEEIDFLVNGSENKYKFFLDGKSTQIYYGRLKLNAFASDKLIEWIESKLEEHGIEKVKPPTEIMESFYRKCLLAARLERYLMEQRLSLWEKIKNMEIKDIQDRVMEYLMDNPEAPWDQAVVDLATEDLEASKDVDNGLG